MPNIEQTLAAHQSKAPALGVSYAVCTAEPPQGTVSLPSAPLQIKPRRSFHFLFQARSSSAVPILPESASILLDVVRLGAALLVVFAHLSRRDIGVISRHNLRFLGELAVPVFFVLSGFVIRFVTVSREHTLRLYLIDRASRVYSIALPAMALTLAVTAVILLVNPTYASEAIAPVATHPIIRVLANLTFLSQVWHLNTVQFANSPFWSLSYECLFYVGYGLMFYLRGRRRIVAVIVWAAISGPQILFLFPLWILGCALYDCYQHIREQPLATNLRKLTFLYAIIAVPLAAVGRTSLLLAPIQLGHAIAALPDPLTFIHESSMRATMLAIANGSLAAVALFLMLLLTDLIPIARNHAFGRRFRRLADGTFVIYLMHYPLLMLARALGLLDASAPLRNTLVVTAIVLLLIAMAAALDALKATLRHMLRQGSIKANFSRAQSMERSLDAT